MDTNQAPSPQPLTLSINEACARAGVGRNSIYKAINRGELPLRKLGKRSLILRADLETWLNALPCYVPPRAKPKLRAAK